MQKAKVMDLSKCGGVCRGDCKHYAIGVECPLEAKYEPVELKPLKLAEGGAAKKEKKQEREHPWSCDCNACNMFPVRF